VKIVIVGCGRVGASVAEGYDQTGHQVLVIDSSTAAFDRLPSSFGGTAIRGDGTDEDVLKRAGAEGADVFLALTEGDNRNVMAAQLAAEELGIERVIAKINDPLRAKAYAELGIATLCRTGLMVDAIDHYLGFPTSGLPGMLAPTGHHEAHRDTGARPATNAAGTLSAVGAASNVDGAASPPAAGSPLSTGQSTNNPVPNAGPTAPQEA
jgi:trk system potassium uptake protein TrkA